MKKVNYFLLATLFAYSLFFVGCKEESKKIADPTLKVYINGNLIENGAVLDKFTSSVPIDARIVCEAEGVLDRLSISGLEVLQPMFNQMNVDLQNFPIPGNIKQFDAPFQLPLPMGNYNVTITLFDKQNPPASASISVTVKVAPTDLVVDEQFEIAYSPVSGGKNEKYGIQYISNAGQMGKIEIVEGGNDFVVLNNISEYNDLKTKEDLYVAYNYAQANKQKSFTVIVNSPPNIFSPKYFISKVTNSNIDNYYLIKVTDLTFTMGTQTYTAFFESKK